MKSKGFTLVELIAVIVIVGLLSILLLNSNFNVFNVTKGSINNVQLNNLKDAAKMYAQDQKLRDCQKTCSGNDYLFVECLTSEDACMTNSKTSVKVKLSVLINEKYFDDPSKYCSPLDEEITIYRFMGDYIVNLNKVTCIN